MTDRRVFQKERPKMEKRIQRDERKEARRRQKGMPWKEQEAICRLRSGYLRTTHGPKMEGISNPLCPFCNTYLSVVHILWEFKETEDRRINMDMRN
jgi:hypothetical protein